MRSLTFPRIAVVVVTTAGWLGLMSAGNALPAGAAHNGGHGPSDSTFTVRTILSGASLQHTFTPSESAARTEPLQKPDDITRLGNDLFVGFQNGVGPQGEPSSDGNTDSTVVELSLTGNPVAQWDVTGKTDGLTADPKTGTVLATVNEDANSALYVIDPDVSPSSAAVTRYDYNGTIPHDGGTDALSIYHGQILVSASAPGTTGSPAPQPTYPAVYSLSLDAGTHVATATPLFFDEDTATIANHDSPQFGQTTKLALTDPDSNEVVPHGAARFGGDFMLISQGDQEQIYVAGTGTSQRLSLLSLSQSVDDTVWPTAASGSLFSTDSTNDAVDVVTGPFRPGQPLVVATHCGANNAPATCPAPPAFPANFLATLDSSSGQVSALAVSGATYAPQGGLVFVPGHPHEAATGRR